ncbi:MAG: hypothetical protein V7709_08065 [Halioglobus sp.]
MYRATLPLVFCFLAVGAFAQDQNDATTAESQRRKALLKEFVVQDRGEVTAIEPSSKNDGSVVIGYASGAVLICYDNQNCKEFGSTPNTPVQQIAVSKNGESEIIWVTYRQGAIYRCASDLCTKNLWNNAQ